MIKITALVLCMTVFFAMAGRTADATPGNNANCQVSNVEWIFDAQQSTSVKDKFLAITCSDNSVYIAYLQQGSGTACPTYDMDSIKIWQSTAMAAMLAGKTITMWYNTKVCAGLSPKNNITSVM